MREGRGAGGQAPSGGQTPNQLDRRCNAQPSNQLNDLHAQVVLDAMDAYYRGYNSNVHRGVHHLSALATSAYEDARGKVATLIGASSSREVVYTRNATEAINLVANSWGMANLRAGDEVGEAATLSNRMHAIGEGECLCTRSLQ